MGNGECKLKHAGLRAKPALGPAYPIGLFGFFCGNVPRAKAPWAFESRPVGAVLAEAYMLPRKAAGSYDFAKPARPP